MPKRTVKPSLDTFFLEGKKWLPLERSHENYRVSYSAIMKMTQEKILAAPDRDEKNLVGNSLHAVYTEITGHSPFDFEKIPGHPDWSKRTDKPDYKSLADAVLDKLRDWKNTIPEIDTEKYDAQVEKEEQRGVDIETLRDIGILH